MDTGYQLILQTIVTLTPLIIILIKLASHAASNNKKMELISGTVSSLGLLATEIKVNSETAYSALIRDRIAQAHKHYLRNGMIDRYELESLEKMYSVYSKTSNGFVKDLMEDLRELPIYDRERNLNHDYKGK